MAVTLITVRNIIKKNIPPQDKCIQGIHARIALRRRFPDASAQEIKWWLQINEPLVLNALGEYEVKLESDIGYGDRLFSYKDIIDFQPSFEQQLISFPKLLEREAWKDMSIEDIVDRLILANREQQLQVLDPEPGKWYPGELLIKCVDENGNPRRIWTLDPLIYYGKCAEKLIKAHIAVFRKSDIYGIEKLDSDFKTEIEIDVIADHLTDPLAPSANKINLKQFVRETRDKLLQNKRINQLPKTEVTKVIFDLAQKAGIIPLDLSDNEKKRKIDTIERYLYSDKAFLRDRKLKAGSFCKSQVVNLGSG